jgi:ABC-type amino acid transport system permease subunit
MRPPGEFVALSGLAGGVALSLATALDMAGTPLPWSDAFKWALPGMLAAAVAAWWCVRWNRRRGVVRPGLLALRTLCVAALCYPLATALYIGAAVALPTLWQGGLQQLRSDGPLMLLALLFGCLPLLWAALPFSLFEYFLCRRYLRRTTAVAAG